MKVANQTAHVAAEFDTKDKQNDARLAQATRARSKSQQMTFGIALVIACLIGLPFGWYCYQINSFAAANCPDWFYP